MFQSTFPGICRKTTPNEIKSFPRSDINASNFANRINAQDCKSWTNNKRYQRLRGINNAILDVKVCGLWPTEEQVGVVCNFISMDRQTHTYNSIDRSRQKQSAAATTMPRKCERHTTQTGLKESQINKKNKWIILWEQNEEQEQLNPSNTCYICNSLKKANSREERVARKTHRK